MNTFLILLFLTVLTCFVVCNEHKHLKYKKKHEHHHKEKKFNKNHKKHHGLQKTSKDSLSVTVMLDDNRQIRGTVNETNTEKATKYYLFQGIPYAKPPIGALRFEPPQEYKLEGNYSATYQRSICIQNSAPFGFTITGTEDCLYLNIYTQTTENTSQLPVLVWIHGGGFLTGDGNYEYSAPDYFVDQNLVVVTLNYRLGVFGFMSTGDEVVPGNMGLKDQTMALKWVRENIVYFGGNPNNVTIMGQSAGAASVTYLVQSPSTKGLFHQAIVHSGNTLCPWALSRVAERNFQLLAAKLLIFGTTKNETVRRMKYVDANLLSQLSALSMNILLLEDPLNGLVYAPVIEKPNPTEFFSYKSYEQLDSGNFTIVPMIIGYNSEEGEGVTDLAGLLRSYLFRYDVSPNGLVPLSMNVNDTQTRDAVGREIRETYAGNGPLILNTKGSDKFLSHDFFVRATIKYVELYSKWGKQIYLYRFSYGGNSTNGIPHVGELQYFFSNSRLNDAQKSLSNKVITLWTQFIRFGNPTPTEIYNVTWIPSSQSNDYSYLDIGEEFVVYNQGVNPDKVYLDKWEYWFNTYGNRPHDTY